MIITEDKSRTYAFTNNGTWWNELIEDEKLTFKKVRTMERLDSDSNEIAIVKMILQRKIEHRMREILILFLSKQIMMCLI